MICHSIAANLPIAALPSVGRVQVAQLRKLGIERLFDLLMHFPKSYENRSYTMPIDGVIHGQRCMVAGQVVAVDSRRGLSVMLQDDTGSKLELKFFRTYPHLLSTMQVGSHIAAFGEVRVSSFGVQMAHPEYYLGEKLALSGIVPVYASTKNLQQNKWRQMIRTALQAISVQGLACLGEKFLQPVGMAYTDSLLAALHFIHTPPTPPSVAEIVRLIETLSERTHPVFERLMIEELTAHQLTFLHRRAHIQHQDAPKCHKTSPLIKRWRENLPFALTKAQQRVIGEITQDMSAGNPMLRLVQGDVGSGKTAVAAAAACLAIDSGWQVVLIAPTEILAWQHYYNFRQWFEPLELGTALLLGKQSTKQRQQTLDDIASGKASLAIGTHALFQERVDFARLGLVVIDEQHRFGVAQRLKLAGKSAHGTTPHQLNMTATPIPRTLAMSLYGDMDVSVIDELPPGRTPITTVTISRDRRDDVLARVAKNCQAGKQAYWVCPLVEESENLDGQSAQLMYEQICQQLPIRVGLIHGRMRAADKQAIMADFKAHKLDLLLATTVIEVGVDVPNASLMVIENAERLGLSQLHQLRGRVGRGAAQSFCVLLYQTPLSPEGIERLNVIRSSCDGFVIAEKDLQMRGAGEILGMRQAGETGYYVAKVGADEALLKTAQVLAGVLMEDTGSRTLVDDLLALWLPNRQVLGV